MELTERADEEKSLCIRNVYTLISHNLITREEQIEKHGKNLSGS